MHSIKLEDEIKRTVDVLKNGGVILYPTDTIWGIGCMASDTKAIDRIYEIKERPSHKSFILLCNSISQIKNYVSEKNFSEAWKKLIAGTDRPTTIIYQDTKNLPPNLIADDSSIAIRLVKDAFCIKLIEGIGEPLVSTSANLSGKAPPASFKEIDKEIILKADHVVSYRQEDETPNFPSRIIKVLTNGEIEVIRG